MALKEVGIQLVAEDANAFTSAIDDANKAVKGFGDQATSSADNFSALGEIGIGALREIGAMAIKAAIGLGKMLVGFGQSVLEEAMEAEEGMAQLDAVLKSTGGAAGMTREEILKLSSSLSASNGLSKFSDDAILAGNNLLLTFTKIGRDVFPLASQAAIDMAQALGTDPQAQAIALGKALNDPIKGVTALTRVGVTFTEQQKATIEAMVAVGDVAGAQKLILAELAVEFGGSASAAAQTFSGQMITLQEKFNDVKEQIGTALLPVFRQFTDYLSSPAVQSALTDIATQLSTGIGVAAQWLTSTAIPALQRAWTNLQPSIAAVTGFIQTSVIPALTVAAQWLGTNVPVAMANISAFWTGTLQPALATMWTYFNANILPVLTEVVAWVGTNVPVAMGETSGFITSTLIPDLMELWQSFSVNVLPTLMEVAGWIGDNMPAAMKVLSDFWTTGLGPALTAMYELVKFSVILSFESFKIAVDSIVTAWTFLVHYWETILSPGLDKLNTMIGTTLNQAFAGFTIVLNGVQEAFGYVSSAVDSAIGWFEDLATTISNIEIPSWMQGHSPPPLADWISYIADAMAEVTTESSALHDAFGTLGESASAFGKSLEDSVSAGVGRAKQSLKSLSDYGLDLSATTVQGVFAGGGGSVSPPDLLGRLGGGGMGASVTNQRTYNYAPTYAAAPNNPQYDFAVMQAGALG